MKELRLTVVTWKLIAIVLLTGQFMACSVVEVKPWQRGTLANPIMMADPDPIEAGLRDHIFFSKEGSSGSAGAGGGGCGCN